MKKYINTWGTLKQLFLLCTLLSVGIVACEDEEWSEDYDIDWPLPTIASFSPAMAPIESEVTITGTNFDKTTGVYVGNVSVGKDNYRIVSPTEIKFTLPRVVSTGKVRVRTAYAKEAISEENLVPQFPATTIAALPSKITRGKSFIISGENVDLITSVKVGDSTMVINGAGSATDALTVPTTGIDLSADMVTVTVVSAKGELKGTLTGAIPVESEGATFDAAPPIVLWDFEDNANPVTGFENGLVATIDGGAVSKARGAHYLNLKASNADGSWKTYGYLNSAEVNPGAENFNKPYISFLVNTNGKRGYFHFNFKQGGVTYEAHMNVAPDNYALQTNGWEWRSYPLDATAEDAGEWKAQGFNPMAPFTVQLQVRTGNVNDGAFELNLDQVMITDGKVNPAIRLWDFENTSASPFNNTGGGTAGFNAGSGVTPFMGSGYYTVKKSGVGTWSDIGSFTYGETLDISDLKDPHLSFWVNTKGDGGYFQLEDGQGSWGHFTNAGGYGDDYKFVTDGWELRSIRLSEFPWEGAGFNPSAFKPTLFVKTGNVAGNFEINLDEVYISDGPMF
jgi:hypothetical protein